MYPPGGALALAYAPPSPGWARGAGTLGMVSAALTLALTMGVVSNNSASGADTARGLGIVATGLFGVMTPAVALGGASARNHPAVLGSPGLRIVSWVGYVLALIDAVTLVAASYDQSISNAQIVSVGMLGAFSTVGLGVDAYISAGEAEALARPRQLGAVAPPLVLQPYVGLSAPRAAATATPTFGLRTTF